MMGYHLTVGQDLVRESVMPVGALRTDVLLEDKQDLAIIRFDGAERLNAFSLESYTSLARAIEQVGTTPRWQAVIVTGTGRAFCSGQDLRESPDVATLPDSSVRDRLELLQQITRRMRATPTLWIAAVNGLAVGFGAEVALACDIRFGTPSTYFMFPELAHDLYFTNATLALLPALIGTAKACELLLSGRQIHSAEALAAGLLNRLVSTADLLPTAQDFATQVARSRREAITSTLEFLRRSGGNAVEEALLFEIDTFMSLRRLGSGASTPPGGSPPVLP